MPSTAAPRPAPRFNHCLWGALAFLMLAPSASANQIFATEASFLTAASGPLNFESFEGLALDNDITQDSLTLAGFSLLSQAGRLGVRNTIKPGVDDTQFVVYVQEPGSTLTILLNAPATEFGVRIMDVLDVAVGTVSVSTNGGADFGVVFTAPLANNAVHYLGIITDTPFTSLTLTHTVTGLDGMLLDAVHYNTVVPEPGTGLLMLTGLILMSTRASGSKRLNRDRF